MTAPQIIHSDADVILVNKPSGWLSIPDRHDPAIPCLKNWLTEMAGHIWVVHRIDRDTSGINLFARNASAHQHFNSLFESRRVAKEYLGLAMGMFSSPSGTFDQPIEEHPGQPGKMRVYRSGKAAITHYTVVEQFKAFALLKLVIETGRTHQIRVHLQNAGHPLVGDPLYGDGQPVLLSQFKKKFNLSINEEAERPLLARLALHAHAISYEGPAEQIIRWEAPLAKDMEVTLKQIRKWSKP